MEVALRFPSSRGDVQLPIVLKIGLLPDAVVVPEGLPNQHLRIHDYARGG